MPIDVTKIVNFENLAALGLQFAFAFIAEMKKLGMTDEEISAAIKANSVEVQDLVAKILARN